MNRGFGAQLSISGARPQQNNYRLDGISINDYSNGGPGSVLGQNLGVEAIQEFSVLTSNYSAEYGKTSGGVVNAISRSGTNQFHGSAYEFLRNSALDADNFFDNSNGAPNRLSSAINSAFPPAGRFEKIALSSSGTTKEYDSPWGRQYLPAFLPPTHAWASWPTQTTRADLLLKPARPG